MSPSLDSIALSNCIDRILVPQGAEYKAVCDGLKIMRQFNTTIKVIQIPAGFLPFKYYLKQWQNTHDFISHPPKGILLMGLGGGLSPYCRVGDKIL